MDVIIVNVNGMLGVLKIDQRGLCTHFCEFEQAKNKLDPQLIAGFFYAMSNFTSDFFGEGLQQLQTNNFKILFKKDNDSLNVYIVDNEFNDYNMLESDFNFDFNYFLSETPSI